MLKTLREPIIMLATVLQWIVLAIATGAIVGTGVSFFLKALFRVTGLSFGLPLWQQMLLLPMAGLANGMLLHYGGRFNHSGLADRMIAAVHDQHGKMPFRILPIKPIAALITLGCGGSAGKEGPCSYLGAMLASGLGRALHVNEELQKRLVACGVSAGFASVFGTPIAGALYGVEILAIGRIRHDFLLPAIIGGVTAYQVSLYWGLPYDTYTIPFQAFSLWLFAKTLFLGVLCGFAARIYVDGVHIVREVFQLAGEIFQLWPPLLPLIGGCLLGALVWCVPSDYFGLSIPLMDRALAGEPMPWAGFLWKALLVAITLGSGFYAGVVTPQFVIGALVGSSVAHLFGIHPALGAAMGFAAVLAAASNTPIAAVLIGVELFGGNGLMYIAGAAISAYLMIGHRSIYPEQHLAYTKSSWIPIQPDMPVGHEKMRLSKGLRTWLARFDRRV